MKSDTSHCCCYFRGIKVETKKGREPGRKRLVKQKVHMTLGKTEHMWAVIILTSTCKTWNTRGRMDKQKDERTAHSFQLEFLLFKTVFIKKKKRERENRKTKLYSQIHAIVLGDCCANNILLHPLEISYPRSLFAYFLCIFNNRHYILAGFICIHFYILWFDCKVFVGKRIVLHNWVSWKCLFIIGDQRTFVSWKEKKKKREGFTMTASYWERDSRSWRVWLF